MFIINLTQHPATEEQIAEGVFDLEGEALATLKQALTFDVIPSPDEIRDRAERIARLVVRRVMSPEQYWSKHDPYKSMYDAGIAAMIGGAPYLMASLERALKEVGVEPLYAFSIRKSGEEVQLDGSVRKVAVFRHAGWITT